MASKMMGLDSDVDSMFELANFDFFNFDETAKI